MKKILALTAMLVATPALADGGVKVIDDNQVVVLSNDRFTLYCPQSPAIVAAFHHIAGNKGFAGLDITTSANTYTGVNYIIGQNLSKVAEFVATGCVLVR